MASPAEHSILIVEDDPDLAELLRMRLDQAGYRCLVAEDGPSALRLVRQSLPSLILLDLMLPHMSGLDVLGGLQSEPETAEVPVIIITAKAAEEDKIQGLRRGAVDYITKPFSLRELLARIENVLKFTQRIGQAVVTAGPLKLDLNRYRVFGADKSAELTATEFKLLLTLARRPGRVYTRDELLNRVWGSGVVLTDRTIDVHIRRIREKVESCGLDPKLIATVRGVGYKLEDSQVTRRNIV
jgi:DNA-binding response OmpR family regulator